MRRAEAIFNTDGVNRQNMLLPLSGLVGSLEHHLQECRHRGLPAGMPTNISHDLCRPIGWSRAAGVYIAKDMSRQVGVINSWATIEESKSYAPLIERYWQAHHRQGVQPYLAELEERLADFVTDETGYCRVEAAAIGHSGLAEAVYPEFFVSGGEVDKDGLVDYAALLRRTRQIEPGVFHDEKRDLVLFAHRFFRRSLSHRNSLNQYALRSFHEAATAGGDIVGRLRLDPDLIGHPASVRPIMELEYWHGPKFDDDIAVIPAGVTEHVNDDAARFYSAVSKTHIWWKNPEERRREHDRSYMVRTFEIEELVEDPSPGLAENVFGCRYAHAEYDIERAAISHFDGAIRAYEGDAYLARLDALIDRAGKQADYTKVFRLDGTIPVITWKRVLSDYYRGNTLVPEYLGAPPEPVKLQPIDKHGAVIKPRMPALSAYIGFALVEELAEQRRHVLAEMKFDTREADLAFAETGRGHLAALLRPWCIAAKPICAEAPIANLSTIILGGDQPLDLEWKDVAGALAKAIREETASGRLDEISVSVRWVIDRVETTLSIAGIAAYVAELLERSLGIVQPNTPAEDWAEPLRDELVRLAPDLVAPVDWPTSTVRHGRIVLEIPDDTTFGEWVIALQTQAAIANSDVP